jgi:tetratricopeptide (TPR) repeat protein
MKSVSSFALGVALVLGSAAVVATAPAAAQRNKQAAPAQPEQRQFKFSKEERVALLPLQNAVIAKDWATAQAALAAAEAAAQGADARYAVARYRLEIGINTNNVQMQGQAIDALIASGSVPAADLPMMYRNQGALALQANDKARAEASFARVVELSPNDAEALIALAQVKNDLRKQQEAVQLVERAISVKRNAGQPVDETWYKYALKLAYDNRLAAQSLAISRDLVATYPTKENWRDALLIYRELRNLDRSAQIDLLRLARASKALGGERDWYELAEMLDNSGLPAEAKATLEEGASLKMIDLNKAAFRELLRSVSGRLTGDRASLPAQETKALGAATGTLALSIADAYLGYGDYAKAVTLYRAALTKGGVDTNIVNTRLGIALALMGNRAEAEPAFKAVTGPRAEIASFWLSWLGRRV